MIKHVLAFLMVMLAAFTAPSFASGADFSAITASISATAIVAAIAAVAAIKILPGVARWGFNQVITWFK